MKSPFEYSIPETIQCALSNPNDSQPSLPRPRKPPQAEHARGQVSVLRWLTIFLAIVAPYILNCACSVMPRPACMPSLQERSCSNCREDVAVVDSHWVLGGECACAG